jgi:hypothetical protein
MKNKYFQRIPRKQLVFYLDVLDQHTHERLGHLGDISKNGMMIFTYQPLAFDGIRDVSIQLHGLEGFSKKTLDCKVEERWARPDINPKILCIGCEFIDLSPEDLSVIEQLQEVLGFND